MKHKVSKQILSILLALVMVIGVIPASTLTVFAAEKTEVTQIETRISAEYVPYAGREYTDLYTYVDTSIYGSAQASGSDWVDDAGVTIEVKGNGDYGEWYDIRYQFEAGRTYTAEYTYMINPAYEETYKFAENTAVTLTNPDPSKCTITGEVIEVRDSGRICDVRYTMTIAGERSYPDIKSATLQKIATPADGVQAETTALMYSNCTLTSQAWSPNVSTFAAGNTYTLTVNLHAKDGYKFSNDFAPVLGIAGYEKAADHVELLNNNEDAAVSFTYAVGDYTYVDTLQFVTNWPLSYFIPTRETSGQPMTFPFDPADGVPFENRNLALGFSDNTYWYNETDGYEMNYTKTFEAGKVYSLSTVFDIKKDLLGEYRFADNATAVITGPGFSPSGYQVECSSSGTSIIVKFLFTAQFPGNEGSSAGNPAMCYTYDEFKYAMESSDLRYVALGNVEDVLPAIPHDEEQDPGGITTNAIVVRSDKDLNLLGNAVFKCPLTNNYDLKYYTELMTLTSVAGSNLYIHGTGSLTYEGGTLYFVNSVIKVEGGNLCVDGATIRGGIGYHTGYCYGINARYGGVSIQGGATIIGENYGGAGIAAMVIGEEGETRSLSVSILNGKFSVKRYTDVTNENYDHGIAVWNDCGLRIYGGSFDGIYLGRYAADTLDEYIVDDRSMTINGQKATPAYYGTINNKIIDVYKEISKVNIHVNSPAAGKIPAIYPQDVYMVPEGCTVESIIWYENGQLWNLSNGSERFEAGNSYKVDIVLAADSGVKFANSLTSATINYKNAKVSAHAGNAETGIVLTVDFGACPNTISNVDLTVTAPKEGNKPSYTVGCASDAYSAVGGSSNYTNYRKWYMSSDGDDWWEVGTNHQFMSGYYYKLYVDIQTASGYEFPLYDNGSSIVPDVSATVNGYYARVIKAYEQDPSAYITVEYDFGMCNDSVVEQIAVVDVTAPVAGERPNYTYNILGTGYQMNTAKNAYYDDWMHDQKLYYIKNGIGWYDLTDDDWVYEHETFIPGHEYRAYVYLIAEGGYEFAYTAKRYENAVTATMNGNTAEVEIWDGYWADQRRVRYTFTCEKKDVSAVILYGLDAPQGDKIPDREITTAYPELYTVEYINWYDCEDNLLYGEDTFCSGERYKVEIKIVPTQIGGVNASQFISSVKAYIDGQEVTERLNWDAVYASANAVYVYYTFTKGASAPEIGAFVSGSVTSFNDASGAVTLQLIPAGSSEAEYETTVNGNTANYLFSNVVAGTYTLKVSKENHVTREYTVVVGNSSVLQDVKIHLNGDINGDGRVNITDVGLANSHAKKVSTLTDYRFACGNVNGDTRINITDVGLLNAHAKKTNLLW